MIRGKGSGWSMTARFLLIFILVSCGSGENRNGIPKEVLPRDKMVDVLTDIHLIEGAKVGNKVMGDTNLVNEYYQSVYSKFSISKEAFDRSFEYYSSNPELMDDIYESVIENLNKMEVSPPRESLEEFAPQEENDSAKTD